jgi:hypothetical protein
MDVNQKHSDRQKGDNNSENKIFFYYKYLQGIQDYISHKSQWTRYYNKQGSNKELDRTQLSNDYMFLVATRQNTLYSITLFFKGRAQCIQDWC